MKKKQAKKLELSKDTVRKLAIRDFEWQRELEQVVGGAFSIIVCQLTEQSSCCPET